MPRVRLKKDHTVLGTASRFNTLSVSEMIVTYNEGDASSEFVSDYDVQLQDDSWKDMREAFRDKDLVSDEQDRYFGLNPERGRD